LSVGSDGLFHSPPEKNWGVMTKTGLVFRMVLNAVTGLAETIPVSFGKLVSF
jgi:hypothetical protein